MFFFFNDTATTEIYTLSLHDALPIFPEVEPPVGREHAHRFEQIVEGRRADAKQRVAGAGELDLLGPDRKSTRLNSSHANISYAVFCLKKKKIIILPNHTVCIFFIPYF